MSGAAPKQQRVWGSGFSSPPSAPSSFPLPGDCSREAAESERSTRAQCLPSGSLLLPRSGELQLPGRTECGVRHGSCRQYTQHSRPTEGSDSKKDWELPPSKTMQARGLTLGKLGLLLTHPLSLPFQPLLNRV